MIRYLEMSAFNRIQPNFGENNEIVAYLGMEIHDVLKSFDQVFQSFLASVLIHRFCTRRIC